jgi:hypothetical protein
LRRRSPEKPGLDPARIDQEIYCDEDHAEACHRRAKGARDDPAERGENPSADVLGYPEKTLLHVGHELFRGTRQEPSPGEGGQQRRQALVNALREPRQRLDKRAQLVGQQRNEDGHPEHHDAAEQEE